MVEFVMKTRLSIPILIALSCFTLVSFTIAAEPKNNLPNDTSATTRAVVQEGDQYAIYRLRDELDRLSREVQLYGDMVRDLRNYEDHIDVVKNELEENRSRAEQDIKAALKNLKASLSQSSNGPNRVAVKTAFAELYDAVFYADRWRVLIERPTARTSVVPMRKLQPRPAELEKNKISSIVDDLEKQLDASDERELAQPLVKKLENLKEEELLGIYNANAKNVVQALKDLKDDVGRVKGEVNVTLQRADHDLHQIQEQIGKKSEGQNWTFILVGCMMLLLLLLFSLSICARLWAACKFQNGNPPIAIIDERTLTEFGGMAFILLTIIILGNTDKLDRQALGPLLGLSLIHI